MYRHKHVRSFFVLFSVPFIFFVLLFSLPPGRNSGPGSLTRLSSPLPTAIRALYLYCETSSAHYFPVKARRIVPNPPAMSGNLGLTHGHRLGASRFLPHIPIQSRVATRGAFFGRNLFAVSLFTRLWQQSCNFSPPSPSAKRKHPSTPYRLNLRVYYTSHDSTVVTLKQVCRVIAEPPKPIGCLITCA